MHHIQPAGIETKNIANKFCVKKIGVTKIGLEIYFVQTNLGKFLSFFRVTFFKGIVFGRKC